ncbi:MAG: sulfoxide reductase heme-binding subunit YedZ [Alphaproteobacteria bacterium]|nr:sulfoxide reductase heme-binding subunit YedZ [Alphaproteobacteria bacterium]
MPLLSVQNLRRYGKPLVFAASLIPFLWLVHEWWQAFAGLPNGLGFNPNETSNRFSGDWALRFLLVSLALTPLSRILKSPKPILFRRMTGLFAYFYVWVHLVSYLWLDLMFDWPTLWADILKRIYITVGMTAFVLLTPLAITSTKGWIKRMGAKRWQKLHKAVYVIAPLAVIHFFMMRKGFQTEPLVYGAIFVLLMILRLKALPWGARKKKRA